VVAAQLAVNLETAPRQFVAVRDQNHGYLGVEVRRQTRELPRRAVAVAAAGEAPHRQQWMWTGTVFRLD
jgi:hypothetical protein